jgi:putative ABC transport system substrate-binding protein
LLAALILFVEVLGAAAQERQVRVGVLTSGETYNQALVGLREGLAQFDYREGHNLTLMIEDAAGDVASLAERAAKIVQAKPDVVFTIAAAPTMAAKQATTSLPIIFAFVADPLRMGLVASYASSQNNLTGISSYAVPISGKRLEILQEIAPGIKRVLVLTSPEENVTTLSFQFLAEAAPKLGIELLRRDVTSREDIEQTLGAMPQRTVDAIFFVPSTLISTHIDLLVHKAKEDRIPLAVSNTAMVEEGALVSYGTDFRLLGLQAAKLVVKVLQGAKPSDLPIQMPEKMVLAINLKTAKAIGFDIPRDLLERTDRFVE